MSYPSMRLGAPGRLSARRSSSSTYCWRSSRDSRWFCSAMAALASAIATNSPPRAALGRGQLHASPGQAREPLGHQLRLGHRLGEEELGRRVPPPCRRTGARTPTGSRRRSTPRPCRRRTASWPTSRPLRTKNSSTQASAALADHADHVLIDLFGGDDLLALAHLVQRLDLVAQHGRPLELLLGGRRLHLVGEPPGQVVVLALQEALHVPDGLPVALLRLPAGARRVAAVDRVLDARALQRGRRW